MHQSRSRSCLPARRAPLRWFSLLVSTMTLMLVALPSRGATAQSAPDDEPGYLVHVGSTRPQLFTATPCQPCRRPSTTTIKLEASVGYGGYLGPLFLDKTHGPQINAAVVVSWGRGTQVGVRVAGFVAQQSGTSEPLLFGDRHDVEPRLYGANIGVQASFENGLWLAKGFGALQYDREPQTADPNSSSTQKAHTMPELVIAAGYDAHLGRHLALQFSLEAATSFATLRGSANVGLMLKF